MLHEWARIVCWVVFCKADAYLRDPEPTWLCSQQAALGKVADVGFRQAMQRKWLAIEKGEAGQRVTRKVKGVMLV